MRRRAMAVAVSALLLAGMPLAAVEVNRVVLRVNDRIVTLHDYQNRLADRHQQITNSDAAPDEKTRRLAEAPKEVLRDFLDENLLLSRADQLDVTPSPEMMAQAEVQARKNWGIDDDAQFRQALGQAGMTHEDFRDRVRETLMYQEVLDRDVMSQVRVTDEELQRYYREHPDEFGVPVRLHLREVVALESSGLPADELERTARDLYAQLQAGKSLDDLAASGVGTGTTSAAIDLGWVETRELDPALAAAVEPLAPGGYAEPVKARGGWHVVQLAEREEAHLRPYEEVRDGLRSRERSKRYQDRLADYMIDLEEKAYISENAPAEAQGFRRERAKVPGSDPLESLRTDSTPPAAPPVSIEVPEPPPIEVVPPPDGQRSPR